MDTYWIVFTLWKNPQTSYKQRNFKIKLYDAIEELMMNDIGATLLIVLVIVFGLFILWARQK